MRFLFSSCIPLRSFALVRLELYIAQPFHFYIVRDDNVLSSQTHKTVFYFKNIATTFTELFYCSHKCTHNEMLKEKKKKKK